MRLAGRRAVVTGAGQGIGRAIALAFAADGAQVLAISRSADPLADLAMRAPAIRTRAIDVTDPATETLVATDAPDILVNCAGVVLPGGVIGSRDADWQTSWEINVLAPMRLIRAALPGMVARGGGAIINVASVASSVTGVADRAAYGTSKAALIGLTKAVAREHVRDGIRCNALCPGTTDTPSLGDRIAATPDPDRTRAAFVARQAMGRLGRPEEMAEAAVFLASDAAAFMTGQLLVMDGGQTL
ncbi:MAG: SDR family oxidoreductase [Rhodobacteraceae bacterium]|jgi:2-keto-3-deoxy-L-fuconate dehydrogenase|nr:SDR family oxidoreductase [Paracoccaceae bacterium]